jgi:hypothetical protein
MRYFSPKFPRIFLLISNFYPKTLDLLLIEIYYFFNLFSIILLCSYDYNHEFCGLVYWLKLFFF